MSKTKNKQRSKLYSAIILLCLATILIIAGQISVTNADDFNRFAGGSVIEGVDVSGLTYSEANSLLSRRLTQDLKKLEITISYNDEKWELNGGDLDIETAVATTVETAFNTIKGHGMSLNNKRDFHISATSLLGNVKEQINAIISDIEKEPVNAKVEFNPNSETVFEIIDGVDGVKVNKEKLFADLEKTIQGRETEQIQIETTTIAPEITKDFFSDKLNLAGSFETSLKNSKEGRRYNVTFALSKFNGLVVEPNETVSFNQITGPQTLEGGYQKATVILNGVFTEGVGGGLCQASTTMYNACVLANLEIVEVHKHTLPVSYVELALDAMVSDGYSDFMFKNTSSYPIYIQCYVEGDVAKVNIFGKTVEDGVVIKRVAEFVGNIPHNGDKIIQDINGEYSKYITYKGEYYRLKYPREGYEAKAYKEYYKDGKLVDRVLIRHEKYMPVDGVVMEGTNDLPKGFVLPKQEVEIIKPETR